MSDRKLVRVLVGMAVGLALALGGLALADAPQPSLIVPYEPSPPKVVEAMLKLANVGKDDVVYDPGCGDGRIVIMAVKKFDAKKGVGIDLDPERLKECKENAEMAGVTDRVEFKHGNIFDQDYKAATVIGCYLLPNVNLGMRPIFFRDLKPGSRIVSHAFTMGDWEQDDIAKHPRARGQVIYLWIIPAPVAGTWEWTTLDKGADVKCTLALEQEFQFVRGFLTVGGAGPIRVGDTELKGRELSFSATVKLEGKDAKIVYRGTADGDTIQGKQKRDGGEELPWVATRKPVEIAGSWHLKIKSPDQQYLEGTLQIARKEGYYTASYTLNSEKKVQPISGFYVWGSSVRFDVPTGEDRERTVDFKGTLGAEAGSGIVHGDGWAADVPWSAQKAK